MDAALLSSSGGPHPVYLVAGEDPSLVSQELTSLLKDLESLDSASTGVEEYGEPGRPEDLDVGAILNACQTPSFLTDRRIVVVRDSNDLDQAGVKAITAYLESPLDSTVLVLANTGRVAAGLQRAVTKFGTVIAAQPQNAKGKGQWFANRMHDASLRLDHEASALLIEHLGEDLARLEGIIGALQAAYGPNAHIHPDELEPFLGGAGAVAPWDLTDALDSGDTTAAVRALHRLMQAGERHPLALLATLHRHYGAMLRLDGAEISDEASASVATGLAPFPAKKALRQARRLGHERITRAIRLLADADLDVRGRTGLPDDVLMEVLVARLAQLVRLSPATGTRRGR